MEMNTHTDTGMIPGSIPNPDMTRIRNMTRTGT